jgi:MFS family permease
MRDQETLLSREFMVLNAIIFLSFCNIALFFQFHDYLTTLPIDPRWYGLLIALFSVTVLIIRPIISPLVVPGNSRLWMTISCAATIPILLLYSAAHGVVSIAFIRVLHGAAYVVLATAATAGLVASIPPGRSAQAFGLISIITLLPYAVLPPLLGPLILMFGSFNAVLGLSALVMLLSFPLIALLKKPGEGPVQESGAPLTPQEVRENLMNPRLIMAFILSLLVWSSFSPIFFFLNEYGSLMGIKNPGLFFTFSTLTEIAVRIIAGRLFDRLSKPLSLGLSLMWLSLGYGVLIFCRDPHLFFALGFFLGIGWGVAMPVLSGLVFEISSPRFRAMNTNLSMVMFQGGFTLGPLIGGALLVSLGYGTLLVFCLALLVVSLLLTLIMARGKKRGAMQEEGNTA